MPFMLPNAYYVVTERVIKRKNTDTGMQIRDRELQSSRYSINKLTERFDF